MSFVREQFPKFLRGELLLNYMGEDLYQVEEDDIEGNEKLFLRYMLMEMANMMKQARLKIKRMNFTDHDFTIINYHFGKMPEWWRSIKKEDMLRTLGVSMMLDDFIEGEVGIIDKVEKLDEIECLTLILMADEYNSIKNEYLFKEKNTDTNYLFKKYITG